MPDGITFSKVEIKALYQKEGGKLSLEKEKLKLFHSKKTMKSTEQKLRHTKDE